MLWHLPAWQVWPPAQALPQAPQLEASVCVLVQTPPQAVRPEAQAWHLPAWQVWPAAQTLPQAPQLLESEVAVEKLGLARDVFAE
jgi:hypothetical protein